MRKIGIVVGSDSDFTQCVDAVHYLKDAEEKGLVEIITPNPPDKIVVASIHRHKEYWLLDLLPHFIRNEVDAIVCGAGWAAHLPGMIDSHLRYDLRTEKIVIVGVAFSDENTSRHTTAAVLSIGDVPGTQVVFDEKTHIGPPGMLHACKIAVEGVLPEITLPDPAKKPRGTYSWEKVLQIAAEKSQK